MGFAPRQHSVSSQESGGRELAPGLGPAVAQTARLMRRLSPLYRRVFAPLRALQGVTLFCFCFSKSEVGDQRLLCSLSERQRDSTHARECATRLVPAGRCSRLEQVRAKLEKSCAIERGSSHRIARRGPFCRN